MNYQEINNIDCIEGMKAMPDNSVDAIVTDPPYGLEFMGKEWDKLRPSTGRKEMKGEFSIGIAQPTERENPWASERKSYGAPKKNSRCRNCGKLKFDHPKGKCKCEVPDWNTRQSEYAYLQQMFHQDWAVEAYRVLKPGGFLLAFGGTRTCHRLTCAIEDAGFEIRDMIAWVYGSGFPKSLNIGAAVNKLETKEWSAIGKALDNIDINDYVGVWKNNLNGVKTVKMLSQNQGTIAGRFIISNGFVQEDAVVKANLKNNSSNANIVGKYSISPQAINIRGSIVRQNVEQIIIEINELQNPVKFAEKLQQKDLAMLWNIFTAGCDVKELLKEKTAGTIKVEEALMTLRGNQKYSNEEIINVLCAVLTENLKHIILSLSKTFQNLDTKSQTECVSAINVTITEYIAECLITNTVNIARQIAVDKLQGNEREFIEEYRSSRAEEPAGTFQNKDRSNGKGSGFGGGMMKRTKGTSEYEGWGTALKPALEPITVARKPLSEKTVAANVLKWGTGGINIDGCRVETGEYIKAGAKTFNGNANGWHGLSEKELIVAYNKGIKKTPDGRSVVETYKNYLKQKENKRGDYGTQGRFPANLIIDGSDEVEAGFPQTKSNGGGTSQTGFWNDGQEKRKINKGDSGSASRFFYCAKASKADRNEGLDGFDEKFFNSLDKMGGEKCGMKTGSGNPRNGKNQNNHPTVKPTKLMQYLVRLVCPKGGVVLDPFMGSGSTGKACKLEGFSFIGFEKEKDYCDIAEARIKHAEPELRLSI